jgi:hypothetical protein
LAAEFDDPDVDAVDFDAEARADFFDAPPFFDDFDPPFFAPCLFVLFAIESPCGCSSLKTATCLPAGRRVPESFGGFNSGEVFRRDYRQAAARISSLTIKFLS